MVAKVETERFPYDMGGYLGEKSLGVLRELAEAAEICSKSQNDGDMMQRDVGDCIYSALHNMTKIVSLAHDSNWDNHDRDIIFERGREGLYDVLVGYELESYAERVAPRQSQPRRDHGSCAILGRR